MATAACSLVAWARSAAAARAQPPGCCMRAAHDGLGDRGGLGVGQPAGALGGRVIDDREDLADQVRPAGRGVVVGRVVERLDGEPDRLVPVEPGR